MNDVPPEFVGKLGVRVKIGYGSVKVIRYQWCDGKLSKQVLLDDGTWRELAEGELYPSIKLVYRIGNSGDIHASVAVCARCHGSGVEG